MTECHIRLGKVLPSRPAYQAPKNAAGIGRINRILTVSPLRPSTPPISTPQLASNTAIPASAPISITR
ncbi:hypothetical protein D3C79_1066200 [compost metagenome]